MHERALVSRRTIAASIPLAFAASSAAAVPRSSAADPVLAQIELHKALRIHANAPWPDDGPLYQAACAEEEAAIQALGDLMPTTLAGAAAQLRYMAGSRKPLPMTVASGALRADGRQGSGRGPADMSATILAFPRPSPVRAMFAAGDGSPPFSPAWCHAHLPLIDAAVNLLAADDAEFARRCALMADEDGRMMVGELAGQLDRLGAHIADVADALGLTAARIRDQMTSAVCTPL